MAKTVSCQTSYLEATIEEQLKNNECTLCRFVLFPSDVLIVGGVGNNERLQEMMRIMCSTGDRYSVDNGAIIAYTGLLAYDNGMSTPLEESTFTKWFRIDKGMQI
ncbi:unnamed protein product [Camellia sinensis]